MFPMSGLSMQRPTIILIFVSKIEHSRENDYTEYSTLFMQSYTNASCNRKMTSILMKIMPLGIGAFGINYLEDWNQGEAHVVNILQYKKNKGHIFSFSGFCKIIWIAL